MGNAVFDIPSATELGIVVSGTGGVGEGATSQRANCLGGNLTYLSRSTTYHQKSGRTAFNRPVTRYRRFSDRGQFRSDGVFLYVVFFLVVVLR